MPMQPFLEKRENERLLVMSTDLHPFPCHLHTEVEFHYMFSGRGRFMVDGHEYTLETGDFSIYFPGVVHTTLGGENACSLMGIFPPSIVPDFPELLRQCYPLNPVIKGERLSQEITMCMEYMLREYNGLQNRCVWRGYIQVLMTRILPMLTLAERPPEMADTLYSILKYLAIHYREPITLDDMSYALGVSNAHLSRCFTQRIGMHFRPYLNQLRANEAKTLLRSSTESVLSIALECGFESKRTFNRVFAELYGMSPTEYRKRG